MYIPGNFLFPIHETRPSLLAVIEQNLAMADVRLEAARDQASRQDDPERRRNSEEGADRRVVLAMHERILELYAADVETLVNARKRALDRWESRATDRHAPPWLARKSRSASP